MLLTKALFWSGRGFTTGLAFGAGSDDGADTVETASSNSGGVAEIDVGVGGGIGMGVGTMNGLIFAASVTLPITVRCETRVGRGLRGGSGRGSGGAVMAAVASTRIGFGSGIGGRSGAATRGQAVSTLIMWPDSRVNSEMSSALASACSLSTPRSALLRLRQA